MGGARTTRIIAAEKMYEQVVELSGGVSSWPGGPHAVFAPPAVPPAVEWLAHRFWEAEILFLNDVIVGTYVG